MGRMIPPQHEDWRARLAWMSLSLGLIALLLVALLAWADWIDAGSRVDRAVASAPPVGGAVVADLLAPPRRITPALPADVEVHAARLSTVAAVSPAGRGAAGPADERRCYEMEQLRIDGQQARPVDGRLCVVAR